MKIAVIGNPNVGKSAVINRLTGSEILVSNYPGTSMEVTKTKMEIQGQQIVLYDTPGIYSLYSAAQEGVANRDLLNKEDIELIINVVDACNLDRNLFLTLELTETGIPMIVLLNQIDRSRAMGIIIDAQLLAQSLGCPVISFSAESGEGLLELTTWLKKKNARQTNQERKRLLSDAAPDVIYLGETGGCAGNCQQCAISAEECLKPEDWQRAEKARALSLMVIRKPKERQKRWLEGIQAVIDKPVLGTVLLLGFAYLGFLCLLKFIQLSEGPINALMEPLNQIIAALIRQSLPQGFLAEVLAKAVPEGLVIPFTIIMPAMLMVSFLMAILEDTGLLPRYSVALEKVGSLFGVSGQAIIPLSLGFGCRTPAILASRIMPNEAQRFIIITLLSIVIPCAATLGILASVIAAFHASLAILVVTMLTTLMILSLVLSRMVPRESEFIYELPPLRIPAARNVLTKIKIRFAGFFTEILPLLLVMSIGIRALMESGVFEMFNGMEGFTRMAFGIPSEAFVAVLITVFQRYLAPLVLMNLALTPREANIAICMIALSLPCLPMMVMTVREIGFKGLFKIIGMGLATSFSVGIVLNILLPH